MPEFLPNKDLAIVADEKVRDYLLNLDRLPAAAKARFFMAVGFSAREWEILQIALVRHARECPVRERIQSLYGAKYQVVGPLVSPDGRNPTICSIWLVPQLSLEPRLITAYPSLR